MTIIQFKNVWEQYRIKFVINKKEIWEDFWALKDVSFDVEKGEMVAIIGENGAGKSTALKLIAGMIKPDRGEAVVKGRVSSLLGLGAGFHPEYTGRENLYLNASLFGLTSQEIDARFNQIVKFSGIGRFIDAQAKSYSQGMFVRLAFAIAIHMDPDILLIDDVMSVGDADFQKKCIKAIFDLRNRGRTVVFVSHDMHLASQLCKRGIFLRDGKVVKDGAIERIISYYLTTSGDKSGVAILARGRLSVVLNNGKLYLNWDGVPLTKHVGGHTTLFFAHSNSNFSLVSDKAVWQIQNHNEEKITAQGKWLNFSGVQNWEISLKDDNTVHWQVDIEVFEEVKLVQKEITLMLTDAFTGWFNLCNHKAFPEFFCHGQEREEIDSRNTEKSFMGLSAANSGGQSLPEVFFEFYEKSNNCFSIIGNTGQDFCARFLQMRTVATKEESACGPNTHFNFEGDIRIFQDKEKLNNYLSEWLQAFHKNSTFEQGDLKLVIEGDRLNGCKGSSYDEFEVFFHKGRSRLYWQGKEVIKNLMTRLVYQGKEYGSDDGTWSVKSEGKNLRVIITWSGAPFQQIWNFYFQQDAALIWEVDLIAQKDLKIENKRSGVIFIEKYESWLTSKEKGDFIKITSNSDLREIIIRSHNNIAGVRNFQANEVFYPGLFIGCLDEKQRVVSIHTYLQGDCDVSTPRIFYNDIEDESNILFTSGLHRYFKAKITPAETEGEIVF